MISDLFDIYIFHFGISINYSTGIGYCRHDTKCQKKV
jgi:hypothetical protein